MHLTRTRRATAASVVALAALAGCSGGGDEPTAGASSTAATAPASSAPASTPATSGATSPTGSATPADTSSNGASQAGVSVQDVSQVVATTKRSYTSPYSQGSVTVGVLPLQKRGKLMVLTMVLTPTIEPGGQRQTASLFDVFDQHVITPTLVDPVNLKQYRVVSGSSSLMSGATEVSSGSGQPMFAYAVFAAPQDPIDTIDVQVADNLPRFTDVPIR